MSQSPASVYLLVSFSLFRLRRPPSANIACAGRFSGDLLRRDFYSLQGKKMVCLKRVWCYSSGALLWFAGEQRLWAAGAEKLLCRFECVRSGSHFTAV